MIGAEYTALKSFAGRISIEVPMALSGSKAIALPALTSTRTVCGRPAGLQKKAAKAKSNARRINARRPERRMGLPRNQTIVTIEYRETGRIIQPNRGTRKLENLGRYFC